MDRTWERIEAWLAVNAHAVADGLNPPASPESLAATEHFLGVQFPDDVRASYLRHDGQRDNSPGLLDGWEWLSLERVRDEWQVWKDLLGGTRFRTSTAGCAPERICDLRRRHATPVAGVSTSSCRNGGSAAHASR